MDCPNPVYLALTATRQLGSSPDGLTGAAKRDDTLMRRGVGHAADVHARGLGELNALALSLAPRLIIVASHLQSQFRSSACTD